MPEPVVRAAEVDGSPSFDDRRRMIRRALFGGEEYYGPDAPYVTEVGLESCIVQRGDAAQRYPYTLAADNQSVTLGTPEPVKLSWQPVTIQAHEPEGTRAFLTDLAGLQLSEGSSAVTIEVCRDGAWQHPDYGTVEINPEIRASFVANFGSDVRRCGELPLDYDHEAGPAPGWIKRLYNEGTRTYAEVDLTPSGREKVANREYRFFSPTWHPNYQDRESGKSHGPTLLGGALTNRPFIRGMAAIQCAEPSTPPNPGAPPQGDQPMATNPTPGADNPEAPVITAAEVTRMREESVELRAEVAALRLAETRRSVETALGALRFDEGRKIIAPASRTKLAGLLIELAEDRRKTLLEAVQEIQFAEVGERGFTPADTDENEITASEREVLQEMAKSHDLPLEALERNYKETLARRGR